jgi:hypothetical protein
MPTPDTQLLSLDIGLPAAPLSFPLPLTVGARGLLKTQCDGHKQQILTGFKVVGNIGPTTPHTGTLQKVGPERQKVGRDKGKGTDPPVSHPQ